jgi:hypothetical protein
MGSKTIVGSMQVDCHATQSINMLRPWRRPGAVSREPPAPLGEHAALTRHADAKLPRDCLAAGHPVAGVLHLVSKSDKDADRVTL